MKEINIPIKTTADTAGVEKLKKELDKLTNTEVVGGKNDLKKLIKSTEGIIALEKQFGLEVDGTAKKIVAQNEAIKNTSGVNAATQSVNALTEGTGNLVVKSGHAQKGMKNMGAGALQAAYFFDDLQYGMKGIMNNIPGLVMGLGGGMGLAGALSVALLAGVKLYDWMADTKEEEAKAKKIKEVAEAARELRDSLSKIDKSMRLDKILNDSAKSFDGILKKSKEVTGELEKQIDLVKKKQLLESGILDLQDETDLNNLETDRITGAISEDSYEKMKIDIENRARQRKIDQEKQDFVDRDETLTKKVEISGQTAKETKSVYDGKYGDTPDIDATAYASNVNKLEKLNYFVESKKGEEKGISRKISRMNNTNYETSARLSAFDVTMRELNDPDSVSSVLKKLSPEEHLDKDIKKLLNERLELLNERNKINEQIEYSAPKQEQLAKDVFDVNSLLRKMGLVDPSDSKEDRIEAAKKWQDTKDADAKRVADALAEFKKAKDEQAQNDALAPSQLGLIESKQTNNDSIVNTAKAQAEEASRQREKERADAVAKKEKDKQDKEAKTMIDNLTKESDALKKQVAELEKQISKEDDQTKWQAKDALDTLMSNPKYAREMKKDNSVAVNLKKMAERAIRDGVVDEQEKQTLAEGVAKLEQAFGDRSNSKFTQTLLTHVDGILGSASENKKLMAQMKKQIDAIGKRVESLRKR